MAKQIGEDTKVTLDLKTIGMAAAGLAALIGMYFTLQADIALANTLDTLRATGAGAGGATALAQAALQSKQGVSASIEKQEVQNQALKAQGEQLAFQAREAREMQRLDRQAGLIERDMAQAMQYRADAMSTLMGGLNASSQLAMMAYGKKE